MDQPAHAAAAPVVRRGHGGVLADHRAAFVRDAGLLSAHGLALADQGAARADGPAGLVYHAAFKSGGGLSGGADGGYAGGHRVRGGDCDDALSLAARLAAQGGVAGARRGFVGKGEKKPLTEVFDSF